MKHDRHGRPGRQTFARPHTGDHAIFIYEDAAALFRFAAPYINDGLAKGERCVYLAAGSSPGEIIENAHRCG